MKYTLSFPISCVLVLCALGIIPVGVHAEALEAAGNLRWYRGNLHTHSHWSDGDDYLEMIALWYREHGYQFLLFTDHNVLANTERWIDVEGSAGGQAAFEKLKSTFPGYVSERVSDEGKLEVRLRTFEEVASQFNKPEKFLLIQGEEISDAFQQKPIHLNVGNIDEVIQPMGGRTVLETIQNNVRAVLVQRKQTGKPMMVHVNHPNFGYAIAAEDLMQIQGEKFFEVYNGHPSVANRGDELHAGTDRMWDIVLTWRLAELHLPVMYGLAVDDGHRYHDMPSRESNPGRGWVMVLAEELSASSLIEAMEKGSFYASSGVTLRQIAATDNELTVEVEPVEGETYEIEFIGTRKGYDTASHPVVDDEGKETVATRRYSPDVGAILKTVQGTRGTYHFTGDEIYVRVRITSSAHHPNPSELGDLKQAWCQPVLGPGIARSSSKRPTQ
jgi:hypothetical protein